MTDAIPRLPLTDAAREWLATPSSGAPGEDTLRRALTDLTENRYAGGAPAVKAVHELRQRLLEDPTPLKETSDAAEGPWDRGTVGKAASDSATPEQGRMLYQLTRAFRPRSVLELGTNIGISAAYIATALRLDRSGRLTTLEASGLRLVLARRHLEELGLGNVDTVEGYFDETLPDVIESVGPFDLSFIDGNHLKEATLRYFDLLCDHSPAGGVLVFDDIRWSDGMWEAWQEIERSARISRSVDLGRTGIVLMP